MMMCATLPYAPAMATSGTLRDQSASGRKSFAGNPDFILFRRGAINTRDASDLDTATEDMHAINSLAHSGHKQTRIVQFAGIIKRSWIERLKATGSEIIGYIPNNAYIIRGDRAQLARVAALDEKSLPFEEKNLSFDAELSASDSHPVRWMGRFQPIQKIAPELDNDWLTGKNNALLNVEIELLESTESSSAIDYINRIASSKVRAPRRFLKFIVLSVTVSAENLLDIARFDEVLSITPSGEPMLHDELSAQIVAANLTEDRTKTVGPGYMDWLESKGLNGPSDFLIDFTDAGLDRGSTSDSLVHPGSRDSEGKSRVAYNVDYTINSQPEDRLGHGSLVASVAVGLGLSNWTDAAGYMYGLGIDPAARFGQSRIFGDSGVFSTLTSFSDIVASAYERGARLSNNSWGNNSNMYDSLAQEYDSLTRDAQPDVDGNQEMAFIFSAGNRGPGGNISSPGTAKNVITVGASENYRPEGVDSCDPDGGGPIGPDGADSALDILRFSAGGPVADGRTKPDITAPGTHIFGAASQAILYNGRGLCPGRRPHHPPNQRLYTWSSGTSLAAPHVTGALALVCKFFALHDLLGEGRAPSPAMLKAYITNSASYLTGENAGGDLPSERQGWGLTNLARAFDLASRRLVDQTEVFSESGQTFEIKGSLADRSLPLRITLAWTDAPGMLAAPMLVNDLDLEITVEGAEEKGIFMPSTGGQTVYRANHFAEQFSIEGGEPDRLNNVESIYLPPEAIPEGMEGNFVITVRAARIAGDGLPGNGLDTDQDFALVIYNITDPIELPPPPEPPSITGASFVKRVLTITGKDFSAAARVEINGQIINLSFAFDAETGSLSVKKKRRKLKLDKNADNQIVIIENGLRSQSFTLRL